MPYTSGTTWSTRSDGFGRRNRRRHRLKGIHSRPDTNRTGAEGLSFYYPRLLHCLDQMLAVMLLSQHRVSSSKTVRPRAPCGARCMGHIVSTWSAVCSEAPHSQFGEGARRLRIDDEFDAVLITSLPTTNSGSSAVWGSKRINPRPQSCLCLTWSRYPSNDDDHPPQKKTYNSPDFARTKKKLKIFHQNE